MIVLSIQAMVHMALELKAGQYVAIRQPHKRMGVAKAVEVAEYRVHVRMQRVAEIHHDGPARLVIVGEQKPTGRHPVLGVVDLLTGYTRSNRGNQLSVVRRPRLGVDDCNKILCVPRGISGPSEK